MSDEQYDSYALTAMKCPKCPGPDEGPRWDLRWVAAQRISVGNTNTPGWGLSPEHLRVSCARCGHFYRMQTRDAA